jgi:DNA-binding response OmpR family regulator
METSEPGGLPAFRYQYIDGTDERRGSIDPEFLNPGGELVWTAGRLAAVLGRLPADTLVGITPVIEQAVKEPQPERNVLALCNGHVQLDVDVAVMTINGTPQKISRSQALILEKLATSPGAVFPFWDLWLTYGDPEGGREGVDYQVSVRTLIGKLRLKLGEYKGYVRTVRYVGYRYQEPES